MASPMHRPARSYAQPSPSSSLNSLNNLNGLTSSTPSPSGGRPQQRRMTTSVLPPPSSLGLPEPVYGHPGHAPAASPTGSLRSSSPLRNEVKPGRVPPPSAARRNSQGSRSGSEVGDDSDNELYDNRPQWARATSPSVTQFAQNLAQRVGSLMSPTLSNRGLPSDAELEAEALRERERSRREAELILTREAEHRRMMEERVLAMMHGSPNSDSFMRPPDRSQTLPNPPSPASSQKDKDGAPGWWSSAKSRLTPTKEKDLTPAQQLIKDTKQREKEKEKETKKKGREKERDKSPGKLNLSIPLSSSPRTSMSGGSPVSPSHSPSRPSVAGTGMMTPVNLSPRPSPAPTANGSPISLRRSPARAGTSPSREAPPLYTSFTSNGTLDVPGTLLLIAKRFEKLERWSVSHVRALEERMGDVERWLVERENEKEKSDGVEKPVSRGRSLSRSPARESPQLKALREEMTELQSRIGEMGREMARLATAPANLVSTSAARSTPVASSAPQTDSSFISSHGSSFSAAAATTGHGATTANASSATVGNVAAPPKSAAAEIGMGFAASSPTGGYTGNNTPRRTPSLTARESTSPPLASRMGLGGTSSTSGSRSTGTRLPYPTGDYTSPENSGIISPQTGSPPSSPPSTKSKARPVSMISGLPSTTNPLDFGSGHSPVGTPGAAVPQQDMSATAAAPERAVSPTGLPVPRQAPRQRTSVSPTPVGGRKRYTVALGGPIVAPDSSDDHDSPDGEGDDDGDGDAQGTLGRTAAKRAALVSKMSYPGSGGTGSHTTSHSDSASGSGSAGLGSNGALHAFNNNGSTTSVSSAASNGGRGNSPTSPTKRSPPNRKARAQSVYGAIGDYKEAGATGSKVGNANAGPGVGAGAGAGANGANGKTKLRAQSIDFRTQSLDNLRLDTNEGRFVDPLVRRRQGKEASSAGAIGPGGGGKGAKPLVGGGVGKKVPIGQLVAFFDSDRR